jgi:hypothetical protein
LFSPNSTTVYKLPSSLMMSPLLMSAVDAICYLFRGGKDKGGMPQSKRKLDRSKIPSTAVFKYIRPCCL